MSAVKGYLTSFSCGVTIYTVSTALCLSSPWGCSRLH